MLVPLKQLIVLSKNINGKGKVVCGALKLQGLNLNVNPGIYFAEKLSHLDAKQTIRKWGMIELHHSVERVWPHGPDSQSYTPHHKLMFHTFNISLL